MARTDISAGILAFRRGDVVEVMLAHPGGPYWARKDEGAWTIPKGLVEKGADLLATAQREFLEETGLVATGPFIALEPVKQKSGKIVHAFACEDDFDLTNVRSNMFEIEWPPRSGQRQAFPEIDQVSYFDLGTAHKKILNYQRPFIAELSRRLER
jgi:predicted NUDIX family NTP pyrophosphohydrolase